MGLKKLENGQFMVVLYYSWVVFCFMSSWSWTLGEWKGCCFIAIKRKEKKKLLYGSSSTYEEAVLAREW